MECRLAVRSRFQRAVVVATIVVPLLLALSERGGRSDQQREGVLAVLAADAPPIDAYWFMLTDVSVLFVAVVGLLVGYDTFITERERGTAILRRTVPVTRGEVFASMLAVRLATVGVSLCLGALLGAGLVGATNGAHLFATMMATAALAALVTVVVGAGCWLSVLSRTRRQALAAVCLSIGAVVFGTPVLLESAPSLVFLHPFYAFTVLASSPFETVTPILETAAGASVTGEGYVVSVGLAGAVLGGWLLVTLFAAYVQFQRREWDA
ncbi:ABC transporter permease subunit [Natronobiforma cellulositropha]|uniref:ABC transporter permease subunit n=1 Tax=Natronobiforma cellulositropha TaxID=1679076 RepID=UPI0021D59264|nr:ABC transporter permease [Natronobiforma cellulositropha]